MKTGLKSRLAFIILLIAFMLFSIGKMYSANSRIVDNGKVDLASVDFEKNELVALNGQWEFYWDKLLTPDNFMAKQLPQMDSFMKVPGTWDDQKAGTQVYPHHGVATYRLRLNYPSTLKDPALRIQYISTAYKLYVNGWLMEEVGMASTQPFDFKDSEKLCIVDLPKDTQELELIFQVANLEVFAKAHYSDRNKY